MATPIVAPAAPNAAFPGYNRCTGELVALIPSCSEPGKFHVTTLTRCDCKGFSFRGRCSHLANVQRDLGMQDGGAAALAVQRAAGNWPKVSPEVAAKAAEYHSIFGRDE